MNQAMRDAEQDESYYTPPELVEVLEHYIRNRWPFMVKSAPGCGKSDIIEQVAYAMGYELIITHPVIDDPIDYKGMPAVVGGGAKGSCKDIDGELHFQFSVDTESNKAMFLPYANLEKLIKATVPTIYFMDDFGQAASAVQKPCMQLLLARQLNGMAVSDFVTFGAATNRKADKAGVGGVLEPVKSRFYGMPGLKPCPLAWSEWAVEAGLPISIVAWIRMNPEMLLDFKPTMELTNSPCPRTIAHMGEIEADNPPDHIKQRMFADAAGKEAAQSYFTFLQYFEDILKLDEIFKSPEIAAIPGTMDAQWYVCSYLVKKATVGNFDAIVRYAKRLREELHVFTVTCAAKKQPRLKTTQAYKEWINRNQRMLKGRTDSFGSLFDA